MSSWTKRNMSIHSLSFYFLFEQEHKWQYLYIQRVISQASFAQFTSNFHHNLYVHKYFLAGVMKFRNSKEMFFVTSHFDTLLEIKWLLLNSWSRCNGFSYKAASFCSAAHLQWSVLVSRHKKKEFLYKVDGFSFQLSWDCLRLVRNSSHHKLLIIRLTWDYQRLLE